MVTYYEVECPNCAGHMKFHEGLESVFCGHCGKEFTVVSEDEPSQEEKDRTECGVCKGRRTARCIGIETHNISSGLKSYEIFVEGCRGDGKCQVSCFDQVSEGYKNYCYHGKCAWCKGTGRLLLASCPFCDGSGNCPYCMGSGKCRFCNGRGKIRCRACDGRGYQEQ